MAEDENQGLSNYDVVRLQVYLGIAVTAGIALAATVAGLLVFS